MAKQGPRRNCGRDGVRKDVMGRAKLQKKEHTSREVKKITKKYNGRWKWGMAKPK